MADAPLPPLPPLPPITPPQAPGNSPLPSGSIPVPPVAPAPLPAPGMGMEGDSADDTSIAESLSPFKLLGKKQPGMPEPVKEPAFGVPVPPPLPTASPVAPQPAASVPPPLPTAPPAAAPAAPVSGSPLEDIPDKETLVRQAAEAPTNPLILPQRKIGDLSALAAPEPTGSIREEYVEKDPNKLTQALEKIGVKNRQDDEKFLEMQKIGEGKGAELLQPKEAKPGLTVEVLKKQAPPPPPPPLPPVMPKPAPAPRPPLSPLAPKAVPLPPKAPVPDKPRIEKGLPKVPITEHGPRRMSSALGIVGLVLVLAIGSAGLYVLALSGARVPLLGTYISGVQPGVIQAANQAVAFTEGAMPYRITGLHEVNLVDEAAKTMPDGTPAVYKLKTEIKSGTITEKGTRFLANATVAANENAPVPVLIRDTGSEYLVSFPANRDTTPGTLTSDNLDDTLLSASLRPLPLEALLRAVQGEQSYQKVVIGDKPAAAYTVSLDGSQLKGYFPAGATLESPRAVISLGWQGSGIRAAQPLDVLFSASFTYLDRKYTVTDNWQYSDWGQTTPPSELTELATQDPGTVLTDLTSESFVLRLGIAFKALPHGTNASSGEAQDVVTTFTPIIPSGDFIEVAQIARAEGQAVPVQPASTDAKVRDAQRKQDLADIQTALEQYKLDRGSYPKTIGEVQLASDTSLFAALVPKYLTKMPVDPLNNTYYYAYNVVADSTGAVTGYYIRSILEDHSDASAVQGTLYHYYQLRNK